MRTVILDSQILKGIQNCAAKTNYQFNMHLLSSEPRVALQRGLLVHEFLGAYYKHRLDSGNRANSEDCVHAAELRAKPFSITTDLQSEDINNVFTSLYQYAELRKHESPEVIDVESPFALNLYENEEDDLRIIYVGMIDLRLKLHTSEIRVWDHKSQSRKSDFLLLDDQFEGYCNAAGANILTVNVIGLQATVKPDEKHRRIPLSYPQSLLDRWKKHVVYWVKQYLIYHQDSEWPENHTSCNKFSKCEYLQLCASVTDEARAWKIQSEYSVGEPWDPTKVLNHRE